MSRTVTLTARDGAVITVTTTATRMEMVCNACPIRVAVTVDEREQVDYDVAAHLEWHGGAR